METIKNKLQHYSMLYGTYMGIFWISKFILFPLALAYPSLSLLYLLLTIAVPFIAFYLLIRYKNRYNEGNISFGKGFVFTLFLYVAASLLVAVAHYIYFGFLDNGYMIQTYESLIQPILKSSNPEMATYGLQIQESLDLIKQMSPIDITIQLLSFDIFISVFISIPTALIATLFHRTSTNKA